MTPTFIPPQPMMQKYPIQTQQSHPSEIPLRSIFTLNTRNGRIPYPSLASITTCKCVSSHRPCLSEEVLKWLTLLMVLLYYWWFLTKSNGFLHSPHLHKSSFNPSCSFIHFFPPFLLYIKWLWQGGFLETTCCEMETGLIISGEGKTCVCWSWSIQLCFVCGSYRLRGMEEIKYIDESVLQKRMLMKSHVTFL